MLVSLQQDTQTEVKHLDGVVGTEMWAALTGLIGWITAKAGSIYDYRFGSSRQSAAKDVIIGTLSRGRT